MLRVKDQTLCFLFLKSKVSCFNTTIKYDSHYLKDIINVKSKRSNTLFLIS